MADSSRQALPASARGVDHANFFATFQAVTPSVVSIALAIASLLNKASCSPDQLADNASDHTLNGAGALVHPAEVIGRESWSDRRT